MADYTPINSDNQAITLTAGAAITGGLLVTMSADDTVVHTTTATNRPVGVAAHDAPSGGRVTVYLLPGFLHELPVESGVSLVSSQATGGGVGVSTTAGRINSTTFVSTNVIGVVVRGTTGTAGGAKARILGL